MLTVTKRLQQNLIVNNLKSELYIKEYKTQVQLLITFNLIIMIELVNKWILA
jgi:hypothetical protein